MTGEKHIIVKLTNGEVEIETFGYKGSACAKASKLIEDAVGGKRIGERKKAEYYQTSVANTQKVGGK